MKVKSLKEKAYKYIKDKIINCDYAPGDFLDESMLIEEIGASRTPIREALNKIEQENLIHILPKKGVIVTDITLKNIVDVYQIRELIEPAAIQFHWQVLEKEKLLEFKDIFLTELDENEKIYSTDDEFHKYIISCYNNNYITNMMDEIRAQSQRIRIMTGRLVNCTNNTVKEHLEIILHILNDCPDKACESLKNHISLSKQRTMEIMLKM